MGLVEISRKFVNGQHRIYSIKTSNFVHVISVYTITSWVWQQIYLRDGLKFLKTINNMFFTVLTRNSEGCIHNSVSFLFGIFWRKIHRTFPNQIYTFYAALYVVLGCTDPTCTLRTFFCLVS